MSKAKYRIEYKPKTDEAVVIEKTRKWSFPFLPKKGQTIALDGCEFVVDEIPKLYPKKGAFLIFLTTRNLGSVLHLVEKHGWELDLECSGFADEVTKKEAKKELRERFNKQYDAVQT